MRDILSSLIHDLNTVKSSKEINEAASRDAAEIIAEWLTLKNETNQTINPTILRAEFTLDFIPEYITPFLADDMSSAYSHIAAVQKKIEEINNFFDAIIHKYSLSAEKINATIDAQEKSIKEIQAKVDILKVNLDLVNLDKRAKQIENEIACTNELPELRKSLENIKNEFNTLNTSKMQAISTGSTSLFAQNSSEQEYTKSKAVVKMQHNRNP